MCFPLHQRHILLEGHRLAVQALDRDRLDVPFRLPDVEALLCRVDPACNALARQTSAHIVVLAVDAQVPIDADRARKRLLMDLPEPMRHSSGEIAPHRRSNRADAVGSALCPTPTHQRNRTKAEGKSRPEALPTKRGSLSKVSMPGKPCRQKNWTTTSKRASASKSPRTSRCNQIEVPASTKLAISTTCCRLPSGSAGTRLSSFRSNWTSSPG